MKKSLLALAVLGAFATGAQAQSTSVTLYGIVDGGLLHSTGNAATNGTRFGFTSGIEATNRWGIRGREDLGGGLAATFGLENGFNLGNGVNNGALIGAALGSVNGKLFDRGATVGLTGGFGSVTLGRNWTPFVLSQVFVDSNNFSNFGSLNSLAFQAHNAGGALAKINRGFTYYWTDNSISYTTPNLGGFTGSLLYGMPGVVGNNTAGTTLSASGVYRNGPLVASIGYFDSKNNAVAVNGSAAPNTTSGQRAWTVGGKYNFGVATVGLTYADYRDPSTSGATEERTKFWDLGASVPFGGSAIFYANYINSRDAVTSTRNSQLYKFAVDYNLSKTTTAYVNLGFTRNNSAASMGVMNAGYTAAGQNQTALGVGMRKAF